MADNIRDNLDDINDEFSRLGEEMSVVGGILKEKIGNALDTLSGDAKEFGKILKRDVGATVTATSRAFEAQAKIQQKILDGANAQNQIDRALNDIRAKRQVLQTKLNSQSTAALGLTQQEKDSLLGNLDTQEEQLLALKKQNKEVRDATGLFGRMGKTITESLYRLDRTGELAGEFKEAIQKARIEGTGHLGILKNTITNLKGAVSAQDLYTIALKKGVEAAIALDKATAKIGRNMQISQGEALDLKENLALASLGATPLGVTSEKMLENLNKVNSTLGGTAFILGTQMLEDVTYLTERFNLSAEAAAQIAMESMRTGQSVAGIKDDQLETLVALENTLGIRLNEVDVMNEANKLTGATRLNLDKFPGGIVKAVAQARMLGVEMSSLNTMAGQLLNFEQSISAELEAELLTGKNLNFEQARFLALQGDTAGAAKLVAEQMGGVAEFQNMNVIQQQALAAAAGLTSDQLADQLRKQEAITSQAEVGLDRTKDQAEQAITQLSVMEKLNATVEKLNELLQIGAVVAGVIAGALGGLMFGPFGALLGAAIGGVGMASMTGGIGSVQDGAADASRGPFTVQDRFGDMMVTANGDNLIATPGTLSVGPQPTAQPTAVVTNNAGVEQKLDKVADLLSRLNEKEGTISMDSTKFGTATTVGTYKMQ